MWPFEGMANPIPSKPSAMRMETTPTTSPFTFTSGPPELPGLTLASVCSKRSFFFKVPSESYILTSRFL